MKNLGVQTLEPENEEGYSKQRCGFYENQYFDFKSSVRERLNSKVSETISETKEDVSIDENDDEVDDIKPRKC